MSVFDSLNQNQFLYKLAIGGAAVGFAMLKTDRFYKNEKNMGMQCYNFAALAYGASFLFSKIGVDAASEFCYKASTLLAKPAIQLAEGVMKKDFKCALTGAALLAAQFMIVPMYKVCKKLINDGNPSLSSRRNG